MKKMKYALGIVISLSIILAIVLSTDLKVHADGGATAVEAKFIWQTDTNYDFVHSAEDYKYFFFVPSETKEYTISVDSNVDDFMGMCALYDDSICSDQFASSLVENKNGEESFSISYELKEGQKYYVGLDALWGETGYFQITGGGLYSPGVFDFESTTASVGEGDGSYDFTVNRTAEGIGDVTVDYTVTGTATSGTDYTLASGTLNFAGGVSSNKIKALITDDTDVEEDETIVVTLSNPTNEFSLGTNKTSTLTITDNDNAGPSISKVTPPSNKTYKEGDILSFTVDFSEAVTVTGIPRIELKIGGSTSYASYSSTDSTSDSLKFKYTIQEGESDTDGIEIVEPLNLNGGTIKSDAVGKDAVLSFSLPTTTGVRVDAVVPTISSVDVPEDNTYAAGAVLTFTVHFSEAVTILGAPIIPITMGSTFKKAEFVSGSGTDTLIFKYTVQTNDSDSNGIMIDSSIGLNGGTIKDTPGNATLLSLNNVASTLGILIDAVAPNKPSAPVLTAAFDTGLSDSDNITKNTILTFTGTAEAGSTVRLYNGTNVIGSDTANGSGNYSITTSTLPEGTHSITVKATDTLGNESATSETCSVTIDKTAPIVSDVVDGSINTSAVSPTFLDGTATLKEGANTPASYSSGTEIKDNGSYVLTVTDTAGNTTSVSFRIAIPKKPGIPQDLVVTPGNGQAKLSFHAPLDDDGNVITGYVLKYYPMGHSETLTEEQIDDSSATSYTINGLTNGIEYCISLAAKYSLGDGDYSTVSTLIGRTEKIITATTIGNLSGGNIINVPYGTTVSTLESKITVSDGASFKIITGAGGSAVTDEDTNATSEMKVKVTAENGLSSEYSIAVEPQTFSVSYNGNGNTDGTVPVDTNKYVSGVNVPIAENTGNLIKTGYTFVGWALTSNGSAISSHTMSSANVTFYAVWKAIPEYTVSYNGNGNTGGTVPIDSKTYVSGANVPLAGNTGNLTKTGYNFEGWALTSKGSVISSYTMSTSNITFYAVWKAIPEYTVSYNGNGNTGGTVPVDSKTYVSGANVPLAGNTGNLTKTGYTFEGWALTSKGSVISSYTMSTSNITFYAVWKAIPEYTVSYNGNGNTGGTVPVDSKTYVSGANVPLAGNIGNLTKTGYTFGGWALTSNGSAISSYTMHTANVTFYAVWKVKSSKDSDNEDNGSDNNNSSGSSGTSTSSGTTTNPTNSNSLVSPGANTNPESPVTSMASTNSKPQGSTSSSDSSSNGSGKVPFLVKTGGVGKSIIDMLEEADVGNYVDINMNGSTTVQSEWIAAVAGQDVDMVLKMDNDITITINGTSITGTDFSNIDFSMVTGTNIIPVTVIDEVADGKDTMQIGFTYDGELGFTATVTIDLGDKNKGMFANLFYYNETTKALEFMGSSEIHNDGTTNLDFKHFSDYVVVIDKVSLEPESVTAGAETSDKDNSSISGNTSTENKSFTSDSKDKTLTNVAVSLAVLIIAAFIVLFVARLKKQKAKE
ncbi:MAG: InlB B-repeat-containing protein [Lachnospiraceae bacterium]|nr:InlB B-repeat-containing protein [Lachnospiraceae bacterium]